MRLRRTKPVVAAFAASVLAAAAALLALDLWWRHDRALASAETRAANLSVALSEYVRSTFALADTSLRQLEIHGRRVGGPRAAAAEWQPILEATDIALPGRGSVSVTDAQGVVVHSTLQSIVGQPRAGHYLFTHLSTHDTDDMVVDEPFPSPVRDGMYVLPVGRRLEGPDGRFAGLVVAVMLPDAFESVFGTIDVGREGVLEVFHRNGVVMFREPTAADPMGQQAGDHPIVAAARAGLASGRVRGPLAPGGPPYVTAYRSLAGAPLIVGVSLSERETLADWRAQVRTAAVGFSVFGATLLALVALLFRQINARRQAEQAILDVRTIEANRLREANDRLEEALGREKHVREEVETASRLKDEFLMTLSHELRTPLNAILGWVRMLSAGSLPEDQRARAIATIERNARTQTHLVEDLLDVSRAITGKLQLQLVRVDLAEVVRAAIETLRPAVAARNLVLTADIADDLPAIVGDAERIQQVVWNLLSNAIKFTPHGGAVTLSVARGDGGVEIAVTDTGRGIPASFLPFVFDRFRQADAGPRRETGGLGLGLAIARHLVELHGGTLTAASPGEGAGATFRVHLPVQPVPPR